MKLQVPFIQLPLAFDATVLAAEIAALGEGPWRPHPQGFAGNSMLPLVAVNGESHNESFAGAMRPTPELRCCKYLTQVFAALGVVAGRSRLMRLSGQAEVTRHADQGYYWADRVRVHVPIVTQPTVRFECGEAAAHMAAGECWIFDTWRQHRVINAAEDSRIHLVVDTVGGGDFWDLVADGRMPHRPPAAGGWQARLIPPTVGFAEFSCETVNVPVVMSPWELNSHLSLLFADAVAHPQLDPVRVRALRFARAWQGLWSRFGDRPEGHEQYRRVLEHFLEDIKIVSQPLRLKNELRWFQVLMAMVGKVAIGGSQSH